MQDAHFLFFERGGVTRTGISRALKTPHWGVFARRTCGGRRLFDSRTGHQVRSLLRSDNIKKKLCLLRSRAFDDPYGNRTHVTAVKGPCLNRLTNGPYIIQDFAKTASNLSATIATDPQVF